MRADGGAAEQLSVLVEADLPFKATGLGPDPFGPYGVVAVLMAVEALVDGADPEDADAAARAARRAPVRASRSAAWDEATQARVRRRLRGVDCADVGGHPRRLAGAGLL